MAAESFRATASCVRAERGDRKASLHGAPLPFLNSLRNDLVYNGRLVSQLANLERKTARGGRDSIDHPQGQHDDLANVCAGLAAITIATSGYSLELLMRVNGEYDDQQMAQRFANEASRPTWGPDAPGAVRLGDGGYRAPSWWR
jgi:hypothetical protein